MSDMSEKLLEFEQNKRNNLIFYGIPNDNSETHSILNQKVRLEKCNHSTNSLFLDSRNTQNQFANQNGHQIFKGNPKAPTIPCLFV